MALNIILRLSNSPSLNHCRRNFSTAINRTRLVIPRTTNQHSTTCTSNRFIIRPVLRQFSTCPSLVSDNMQDPENLLVLVEHLKTDVDLLREEIKLLRNEVKSICIIGGQSLLDKDIDNTNESLFDDNDKATEKMLPFEEAMATHYDKKIVISLDNKAATEKMNDSLDEIQKSDTQANIEVGTEKMSDISQTMARIEESDTVGNETAPIGKEQEESLLRDKGYLLTEIETEISRIMGFLKGVSSEGAQFPDDFPFELDNDVPGVAVITWKRQYNLENIVVTVQKPSVFHHVENYIDYSKRCYLNFKMLLTVEIFPAISLGRKIAFDCSAYSSGFYIKNVYGSDNTKGLLVRELNDDLQKEFKKYLETRGITSSITNVIFGYMLDKVKRENLILLWNLKKTIEA